MSEHQSCSSGSAPVVKSFTGSTKNDRCLEVWFADEVTDETRAWLLEAINEKALRGAAQGVLDRGDVARIICCGSTGCQFVGDSEDGSKCYCDTSDFHGSGVERKTGAILALSAVTPSPGPGETQGVDEAAIIDRIEKIMTWLREPDWTETASLEWLKDWMNRRPIAELAMVAMLMPSPVAPSTDRGAGK